MIGGRHEVRDYNEGDESAILDLFELVFGKSMSRDFWKWRFVDNPSGEGMILYPISDVFLVQWEPLLQENGKRTQYCGSVL